jgi:hypothetical protein
MVRILATAALTLALAFRPGGGAAADAPTLAKLQPLASTQAPLEIIGRAGLQLSTSPVSSSNWKLTSADTVAGDTRPADRLIELYTGTASAPILLCRILLRYYPSRAGWIPYFQLNEEPLLTRVNGRWQPIEIAPGVSALLVRKGGMLPNAEGFFPAIEFGLSSGPLTVVGWRTR